MYKCTNVSLGIYLQMIIIFYALTLVACQHKALTQTIQKQQSDLQVYQKKNSQLAVQNELLQSQMGHQINQITHLKKKQTFLLQLLKEQEKQAKMAMRQAVAGTVAGVLGAPVEPLQQYGLLSATGKISPYAGVSEDQILNTSLGLDEDELDPGIILGG